MQVGVLGPLLVSVGGRPVPLPGAKQQALVAMLALHAGRPVSADRLIELLWGDELPGDATNALQARVSQLRKLVGRDRLTSQAGSYVLHVDRNEVDALAFDALAAEGLEALGRGASSVAADRLRDALALWRGEALVDVGGDRFFQLEAQRLEVMRLAALEGRIEADLALGRHLELSSELPSLVQQHPLRERLRGQLMLALYRSGRQADALASMRDARDALADELGLDPGPDLQALELAILRQDPRLAAPATAVETASPNRIRKPLTTFVGREDDVRRLRQLLATHRLVTLTGPGGAGKTRLAVEIAVGLQDDGSGEAWLVELAGVTDAAMVPDAVASVMSGRNRTIDEGGSDPLARVVAHLGERPGLLVLDNCEHVIDAAARAADLLLGGAPGLRILATSREPLNVAGEVQWPVQALPIDDAVRLFVDRANASRIDFATSPDDHTVADICGHLDGMPLALELAAARVKVLPVEQIAARLDDRFRLLTDGNRTALPRQRTLRALVDWSYELLFEDERRVFSLLSVFAGSFQLDEAESLCELAGVDRADVVTLLGRLVDKSLVQGEASGGQIVSYRILETLREYGRDRLTESDQLEDARAWHAAVYAALAAEAAPVLFTGDQQPWLVRLSAARDNLVAAFDWSIGTRRADIALRFVDDLSWFWFLRGWWREGSTATASALAIADGADPADRARALGWRCHWAHEVDVDLDKALAHAEEAVRLASSVGDETLQMWCRVQMARTLMRRNEAAAAEALLPAAARHFDDVGDPFWAGVSHYFLAVIALAEGRREEAATGATACLDDMRRAGERWGLVIALLASADVLEAGGRGHDAVGLYHEALVHAGEIDFVLAEAHTRVRLANLLGSIGDAIEAQTLAEECLAVGRQTGDAHLIGFAAAALGRLHRRRADFRGAEALHHEALMNLRAIGSSAVPGVLHELGFTAAQQGDLTTARARHLEAGVADPVSAAATLEGLAGVAAAEGDGRLSATLLGAAEVARETAGFTLAGGARFDVDRVERSGRDQLGETAHRAAFDEGRCLSVDEAITLAVR